MQAALAFRLQVHDAFTCFANCIFVGVGENRETGVWSGVESRTM